MYDSKGFGGEEQTGGGILSQSRRDAEKEVFGLNPINTNALGGSARD
jgi:hypothetical protein